MNIITVSKNTYEYKKELKAAGFVWDANRKSWTGDADKITLDFQREAIIKLAQPVAPSASMCERNGPGRYAADNQYL